MTIGWALSGGGNLGAMQVGSMVALLSALGPPDVISGVSVGAVNGAALAANPTPEGLRYLQSCWLQVSEREIFPGRPWRWALRILFDRSSLTDQRALERFLEASTPKGIEHFSDLQIPLYVLGTDLRSGRRVSLGGFSEQLELREALLISTCLPGVFPPRGDLVDGGVISHVAIRELLHFGVDEIIAIILGFEQPGNVQFSGFPARDLISTIARVMHIAYQQRIHRELAEAQVLGVRLHAVYLSPPQPLRFWDFSKTEELISWGYSKTQKFLESYGNIGS